MTLAAPLLLAGCFAEPSPVCSLYIECLYPLDEATGERGNNAELVQRYGTEGDASPYYDNGDQTFPNREATIEAMGPGGECWAYGPGDPYYQACAGSCVNFLDDDCEALEDSCPGAFQDADLTCGDVAAWEPGEP